MRERQRIGNYIGLMIGYMIVLAMVIASAPSHAADGPTRLNNESFVRIESLGQGMSQFGLDDQGTLNDRDWWVDARFLGGFAYALENMTLEFELEAWTGQLTGDTTSVGTLRGEDTFPVPSGPRCPVVRYSSTAAIDELCHRCRRDSIRASDLQLGTWIAGAGRSAAT